MSGHSKWHSIKHQKGVADARRGQLFTKLTREIIVAAREGGGNPEMNFRLRLAVQKARDSNMPMDNIDRAIKKGTGELEGGSLTEIILEGYGPSGGDPVDLRAAIVSIDFLAADTVATRLMGFDPDEVGYLHYCKLGGLGVGDLNDIEIVGNVTIEESRRPFKPHPTYRQQLQWRLPSVEEYL